MYRSNENVSDVPCCHFSLPSITHKYITCCKLLVPAFQQAKQNVSVALLGDHILGSDSVILIEVTNE